MKRRSFIKSGLLFVPTLLLPRKSLGQFASFNDQAFMAQGTRNGFLNNLAHYYKLQETSPNFVDVGLSASNTPLNWANSGLDFTQVAGHVEANAGNYDGSNGFNMIGTLGSAAPNDFGGGNSETTALTFSIWLKPSNSQPQNSRTAIIIGTWDNDSSGTAESWVVALNAADNTKVQMFTRDSSASLFFTPITGTLTLNAWNLLNGGWDSGNNTAWISVNNGALGTVSQASLRNTAGGARFNIANTFPQQRECNMSFESIGIWNRNFTAADRTNLWNSGNGIPFSQFTT